MAALPTPADPHSISRADLWPEERYAAERRSLRGELVAQKKYRRVEVGPHAVFYFENWLTMWMQIQEMLHIEKGGDEQVEDELSAYGSLIPQGNELVATVMFEIPDEERRKKILATLGGVEETMFLEIDGVRVVAIPEQDVDRTTADGKASSVQFVHFKLDGAQVSAFRTAGCVVRVGMEHSAYGHAATLSEETRSALAGDLD